MLRYVCVGGVGGGGVHTLQCFSCNIFSGWSKVILSASRCVLVRRKNLQVLYSSSTLVHIHLFSTSQMIYHRGGEPERAMRC